MLNKDYTAKLLDLEDAIITNVENISGGGTHVYLELPRIKAPDAQPAARSLTVYTTTECRRSRMFRFGRKTLLHLRKRRYRCDMRQALL